MNLSVIIPNYNGADYIIECLSSIVKDLEKKDEIIVVDDASTDGSLQMIKSFASSCNLNIIVISLIENSGGPAKPRNCGFMQAKNNIVCFMDNDDIWLLGRKKIITDIFKSTNSDVVFTKINENFRLKSKNATFLPNGKFISRTRIALLNELKLSTSALQKHIFLKHEFNEDVKFSAVEDFLLWMQISKDFKVYLTKSETIWYRRHKNNISSNKFSQAKKVLMIYKKETSNWLLFFLFYVARNSLRFILRKLFVK